MSEFTEAAVLKGCIFQCELAWSCQGALYVVAQLWRSCEQACQRINSRAHLTDMAD